jgi:membrane protein
MSMMKSVPPLKGDQKLVDPEILEVQIQGLSDRWNSLLTNYFTATIARTRTYWLLASLIRHQSVRTANAMAFDLFLALVPMLGLAGWSASLILRREIASESSIRILQDLSPAQLEGFIGRHFDALSAAHLAPVAALVGWWVASSAFSTMMDVFEETFECRPRSWLFKRVLSLGLALVGMLILGLGSTLGVMAALALSNNLTFFDGSGFVQALILIASLGIATSFLALLYRYSIHRPRRTRKVWAGAVLATLLGALASLGLGYYATHLARYALFYGGLAAIVVLLLWLWLWSTAILLGAELNVAMEDVLTAKRDAHFVTGEPPTAPTQTPKFAGNSDGV